MAFEKGTKELAKRLKDLHKKISLLKEPEFEYNDFANEISYGLDKDAYSLCEGKRKIEHYNGGGKGVRGYREKMARQERELKELLEERGMTEDQIPLK